MNTLKYVTIDRVFSKMGRDLKGTELNESDVIEWIGEALEFLKVPQILEEKVSFLKVEDYHAEMPSNLHMITQIAKNKENKIECTCESTEEGVVEGTTCDCCEEAKFLNLDWTYTLWTSSPEYLRNFSPVRLATGTFFNSLVCKEKDNS